MMKITVRILMAYLLLVSLFTGLLVAAFLIPHEAIEAHVRQSVQEVIDDGETWDDVEIGMLRPWKLGRFSDCLMLGIAYCADSHHPLQSAMSDKFMMCDGSPVQGARLMSMPNSCSRLQPVIYSRYWNGNQVVLRPLLAVTTVKQIYRINIVLLSLLWLMLLVVMWRRVDHASALIIMLSLAAVMIPSVPMCLNYVPTFYIAMTGSLIILTWRPSTSQWSNTVLTFGVIGAVTSYLDLLTTPLITMAIPLIVYMLRHKPRRAWRTVILLSSAWLVGYASLWATKWLLAAFITGHATLQDAMGAMTQRTVGHGEQDYMRWCLKWTLTALLATSGITALATALVGKSRQSVDRNSWMLLVASSCFAWVLVLLEHTWHHLHFTWRTFVILFIGIALFLYHTGKRSRPQH